jgi:hypothetical protein
MDLDKRSQLQQQPANTPREKMIPVDGRGQVLEMLRVADPAFREKLLRQIERRDPQLARELRRDL